MPEATIRATRVDVAPDCVFGDDVVIEAEEITIASGCKIGVSGDDDFRTPGGVRIRVRRLTLGPGVTLGRALRIEGGDIQLDEGVRINRNSTIRVLDRLRIGAYGTVGEQGEIMGRSVEIGQELWMLPQVKIGGGSAFERDSRMEAGHFLHLGVGTLVNTARPVIIGNEVGLGTRCAIYTHGAYPSRLQGFPVAFAGVEIGDYTWIPGATINPGVRVGKNCVVGVNSLVTRDIPDGSLAGGSPAKVIREGAFPKPLDLEARRAFYAEFLDHYGHLLGADASPTPEGQRVMLTAGKTRYIAAPSLEGTLPEDLPTYERTLLIGHGGAQYASRAGLTVFDTEGKHIYGVADPASARLANELRRYGIRFYSRPQGAVYHNWA